MLRPSIARAKRVSGKPSNLNSQNSGSFAHHSPGLKPENFFSKYPNQQAKASASQNFTDTPARKFMVACGKYPSIMYSSPSR